MELVQTDAHDVLGEKDGCALMVQLMGLETAMRMRVYASLVGPREDRSGIIGSDTPDDATRQRLAWGTKAKPSALDGLAALLIL